MQKSIVINILPYENEFKGVKINVYNYEEFEKPDKLLLEDLKEWLYGENWNKKTKKETN